MVHVKEKVHNLVLGAGIAGLAYASGKNNDNTVLCEKEKFYGGLCSSFEIDGFSFDTAVHLCFTNNTEALELFNQTHYYSHKPISYNFYNNYWLKHPAIFNLEALPIVDKVELIQSFIEDRYNGDILNYKDWLNASYGKTISEKLYEVYTNKYWTVEPRELSTTWIGGRINIPSLNKILTGAFKSSTGNDYYASEMRYPVEGRYQSFLKPLLKNTDIRYSKKAVRINLDNKEVFFSDGSIFLYDNLISSVPIPELINIIDNVPDKICNLSKELIASKISLVSIGFNKPDIPNWLWFYIYDKDIMAARVNSPSLKSPNNVPKGSSSMQFEIYHKQNYLVDKQEVLNNVMYSLNKMKICNGEDIVFMDYRLIPYGNVIFYNGMEKIRDEVKSYLKSKDIKLIGRFGEWDYLWSDQSYLSGLQAAKQP